MTETQKMKAIIEDVFGGDYFYDKYEEYRDSSNNDEIESLQLWFVYLHKKVILKLNLYSSGGKFCNISRYVAWGLVKTNKERKYNHLKEKSFAFRKIDFADRF